MRTFRDAKTMAKTLRAELLERKQVELSHSECLEIVSRQFGHDNWNVMAAKTEQLAGIHSDGSYGPTAGQALPSRCCGSSTPTRPGSTSTSSAALSTSADRRMA
jgi:Glyoxalase superfamily protein